MNESYLLLLFVAGTGETSVRAEEQVRQLGREVPVRVVVEVIDVCEQHDALAKYQVMAAPTLIRTRPRPIRRVLGDLSDHDRVCKYLDIPTGSR